MLVIGADLHKHSHTCAGILDSTGDLVGERTAKAVSAGFADLLEWAKALGSERVWVLEDCRHVSAGFERFLLAQGERVIRVPPHLTAENRRTSRKRGKTDAIDALCVARVALRDGIDTFPEAVIDEQVDELKELDNHRDNLVRGRTQNQNRLRDLLHFLWPELDLPPSCLNREKWLKQISGKLRRADQTAYVRIARDLLRRIQSDNKAINALHDEIKDLVEKHQPTLLTEIGCGPLTAATIIAETAGIQRIKNDAKFARLSGTAPIPVSSGKTNRHRLDRGGNRRLNAAFHRIAITKARLCPKTQAYLAKKRTEGKTTKEALRCLKRHLTRHYYRLLTQHKNPQFTTTQMT